MEKDEFIRRAKELGYTDEMIADDIKLHEEAEKEGIKVPWELRLVELPVS
ncbi:hypothetical protein EV210_111105 [Anaerospora hongkongensis]|uniref:Uncharacterized protein n=1 Tax=Anaerospora hongkongensis TaxID=244830 RepID=A0A4R1Q389_9FIRM|nr:hypothetical protein [Anaerospora hongkongensis]TCL35639.1 hypothetical protein EV210_111105 [Anaerospora hongkongensis]